MSAKQKACAICGEMFTPTCGPNKICPKDHFVKCPICGKERIWNSTLPVEPCSKECKLELRKRHNLEKYGVDHPMKLASVKNKLKETMVERYGAEYPLQAESLRQKAKETNQRKYGVDWTLGNKDVYNKSRATMEAKYGAATTMQSEQLRQAAMETCVRKYLKEDGTIASNSVFVKYAIAQKKNS